MAHFAKVENGIVTDVLVVSQEVVDSGILGDPKQWIQTSYNTHGNVHYGSDGKPDGGVALRGNYAGIGYIYDDAKDVFYAPQPFPSWLFDDEKYQWYSPIPYPIDGKYYDWDEATLSWVELSF